MKKNKERVYISGKMSGLSREEVIYRFARCELWLRHNISGRVVNPCRVWAFRFPLFYRMLEVIFGKDRAYELVLLYDLWLLSRCTRIHMIGTDWSTSRGAKTEMEFAKNREMLITVDVTGKKKETKG